MKITRQNYEAFLLDALEGTLTSQERRELNFFLEQNPDLNSDQNVFTPFVFRADNSIVFPAKETLRKKGRTIKLSGFLIRNAAAILLFFLGAGLARIFWQPGNQTLSIQVAAKPALAIDKYFQLYERKIPHQKAPWIENISADPLMAQEEASDQFSPLEQMAWTAPQTDFNPDLNAGDLALLEPEPESCEIGSNEENRSMASRLLLGQVSSFLPESIASDWNPLEFLPEKVTIEVKLPRRKVWEKLFNPKNPL